MKILIVDDEKLLVKGMKFNFEQDGYTVETAYDGEEALKLAHDKNLDIIILDPPYEKGFYTPALEAIFKNNLLTEEGVIVCEHLRTHPLSQDFFEVMDIKNYGTVTLTYLTKK